MKGRMKNIYKKILKYPVTIWMVLSVIVFTGVYVAYSAYNGTAEVKRVVSTQPASTTVFSSNYLEIYSQSNLSVKDIRTTTAGNYKVSITVCNYDQLDPTKPAKALIDYTLKAELVRLDPTNGYVPVTSVQMNGDTAETFYIQKTMNDNQTVSADAQYNLNSEGSFSYTYTSESLTGGSTNKDSFDICFDAAEVAKDAPQLFIRVTATPSPESVDANGGISTLQSIISVAQGRSVETGWHGSLQETEKDVDYDGYNLVIEGSGAGTIEIHWDDKKFAMNPAFITLNGSKLSQEEEVEGRTGWKKRILSVDSMQSNRYVVQFYKRVSGSYTGNNFASNYIYCTKYVAKAVEDQQEP